jgi:hypothetical protein
VLEAKVLISLSHEETYPEVFIENSRKGISHEYWYSGLTEDVLDKYSCVLICNPRESFLENEIKLLDKYLKEYKLGIFLVTDFKTPREYEVFKKNDLIKRFFGSDLIFKQFIPEIDFGPYELVYKKEGFLSSDTKRLKEIIKLSTENLTRKISAIDYQFLTSQSLEGSKINEDDRPFVTSFGNDLKRCFLQRLPELKEDKKLPDLKENVFDEIEKMIYPYKEKEGYELSCHDLRWKIYDFLTNTLRIVGMISDISSIYGVALATDKPFEEINKKTKTAELWQKFLEDILVWVSRPAVHKLQLEKTETVPVVKKQIKIEVLPPPPPEQKLMVIPTDDRVVLNILWKSERLGRLLERGRVEELLNEMKSLSEILISVGNYENFGDGISYFYRKFDQLFSSQGPYQIPGDKPISEAIKIVPELNREKENLHKLIERIIYHYEEMRK